MTSHRWEHCVLQRGHEVELFASEFLGQDSRRVLLISGAGFDPRSTVVCRLLSQTARKNVSAIFLREERPNAPLELRRQAEFNVESIRELLDDFQVMSIPVFAADGAVVGGREVAQVIEGINLSTWTDIIVDFSSLSKGVSFPAVRHLLVRSEGTHPPLNLHLMVTNEVATDAEIVEVGSDRAEMIAGFEGKWGLAEISDAAKLWLPQLIKGQHAILDRIHRYVNPDDVCPILPFPAANPRRTDELIEEYGTALENTWEVEPHDLVYADESNPLDLYRTILQLDELRSRVFKGTGGSIVILSPVGSKVMAIGSLMAALERDFPVAYVEAIDYNVNFKRMDQNRTAPGEIIHIWLQGQAYAN